MEYLHRGEIDDLRWDEVIARSPAETLYPYSWYLDAVAENWSALVMDDYRFIMPLVWKRKFGVRYLYQPVFCQQLGVFSQEITDPFTVSRFTGQLPVRFRFGNVSLNMQNRVGEQPPFEVTDRSNYVLPLQKTYEELSGSYSVNARRNLKKSLLLEAGVERDLDLDELIDFKRENDLVKKPGSAYRRMRSLFGSVVEHSRGSVYGMRVNQKLIAAAFIGFSRTRAIYLMSVSGPEGKESRAMFRIVDEVIRSHAQSGLSLDFEGSNIPSIARFFSGFGAKPEIYQSLSFNKLPVPLLKRRKNARGTP
jgi:hypothetical protein